MPSLWVFRHIEPLQIKELSLFTVTKKSLDWYIITSFPVNTVN